MVTKAKGGGVAMVPVAKVGEGYHGKNFEVLPWLQ